MQNMGTKNIVIIIFLGLIALYASYYGGFFSIVTLLMWGLLIAGLAAGMWMNYTVPTKRLVAFILTVFVYEYFKETQGIASGMWTYSGNPGAVDFGVWCWVIASLGTLGLAYKILIPLLRKVIKEMPVYVNFFVIIIVFALIPILLGPYWQNANAPFWALYGVSFVISAYAATKMGFPSLIGVVIMSMVMGNIGEYIAGIQSGLWTFAYDKTWPPFYLSLGGWPLEILSQYTISALIAGETLDVYKKD